MITSFMLIVLWLERVSFENEESWKHVRYSNYVPSNMDLANDVRSQIIACATSVQLFEFQRLTKIESGSKGFGKALGFPSR